ncbi:MAG: hypothetical protein ACO3F2_07060 [Roseiflexaceae bacterium]
MNPETTILIINTIVVVIAYTLIYPRYAKSNMGRLAVYDMLLSLVPLSFAWWLYADSGHQFNIIITQTNWFIFTLVTYFVVEMPLSVGYMRAYYKEPTEE